MAMQSAQPHNERKPEYALAPVKPISSAKLGDAAVAKPVAWVSDKLLGTRFLPPKDNA